MEWKGEDKKPSNIRNQKKMAKLWTYMELKKEDYKKLTAIMIKFKWMHIERMETNEQKYEKILLFSLI